MNVTMPSNTSAEVSKVHTMRSIRGSSCACFILQPAKTARPVSVSDTVTCWHCTAPSSGLLHYELPQVQGTSRHCYARLLPFGITSGQQAPRVLRPRAARTSRAAALSEPSLETANLQGRSPPRLFPIGADPFRRVSLCSPESFPFPRMPRDASVRARSCRRRAGPGSRKRASASASAERAGNAP